LPAAVSAGSAADPEKNSNASHLRLSDVDFDLLYAVIEQMAHLLSDRDLFKGNVSQKVAQKQLPREWTDVGEMLPGQPLLKKSGDEWHWLFDINANPLQLPPIASVIAGPAAMQPKAAEPGQVAFTESKITFVEAVEEAIRFYTDQRLNLDKLGTDLRLLAISPTYISFSMAASSYRASAGSGPMEQTYPSLTTDKALIEEYERNIRSALKSIKRTMFLAELLAWEKISGNASPGTRTRDEMIKLIAADLDFNHLNAAQIDALLAEFKDDFEPDRQAARDAFERIALDDTPLSPAWVRQLEEELQILGKAYYSPPYNAPGAAPISRDLAEIYFAGRGRALIMHARDKRALKRLSFAELTARAVLELPPLHGDPEMIRLLDYSDSFVATKSRSNKFAPLFELALLATLGFGKQIAAQVPLFAGPLSATVGEELTADLIEAAKSSRRSGERVMLVVGGSLEQRVLVGSQFLVQQPKGEGSYAAAWTMSKTHAVLPIHHSDIQYLGMFIPGPTYDLVPSLELTLEIHDVGLTSIAPFNPQIPQALLGSPDFGTPTSLDDAIANVRKNFPLPVRETP
jgi:hypothetical protein